MSFQLRAEYAIRECRYENAIPPISLKPTSRP